MMRIGKTVIMTLAAITLIHPAGALMQKNTPSTASPPKMSAAFVGEEASLRALPHLLPQCTPLLRHVLTILPGKVFQDSTATSIKKGMLHASLQTAMRVLVELRERKRVAHVEEATKRAAD